MSEPSGQLFEALKQNGYSTTAVRQIVFNALRGQEPLAMHELAKRCPSIDRASVYRTIALFESLGIVQRLQIGWKYKLELSDQYVPHHHHASCLRCGRMIALPEDVELEERLQKLAKAQNFQSRDHQIEIRGLCSACQA